jgi:prophage antirepressor-like protein
MEEIKIFNSPQFGEIRTTGTSENPLFCLADLCSVLELRPNDVRQRLDDGVVSTHPITDNLGRKQQANFVNEDGLYDVILDSRKPQAKAFRKWVTSEVLPSIRKTGSYSSKQLSQAEMFLQLAQMNVENERKMKELEAKTEELQSELTEIKQRTTTDLKQSTIVAFITRNNIKLDVTKYGAMGRKATSICKRKGIEVTKINDVRWGKVSVYPDEVLNEVFKVNE